MCAGLLDRGWIRRHDRGIAWIVVWVAWLVWNANAAADRRYHAGAWQDRLRERRGLSLRFGDLEVSIMLASWTLALKKHTVTVWGGGGYPPGPRAVTYINNDELWFCCWKDSD